MKNKSYTEAEQYFAAKNHRREWWKKNGQNFIIIPLAAAMIVAFCYMLSVCVTQVGLRDKLGKDAVISIVEPRFNALSDAIHGNCADIISNTRRIHRLEQQLNDPVGQVKIQPDAAWMTTNVIYLYQ